MRRDTSWSTINLPGCLNSKVDLVPRIDVITSDIAALGTYWLMLDAGATAPGITFEGHTFMHVWVYE